MAKNPRHNETFSLLPLIRDSAFVETVDLDRLLSLPAGRQALSFTVMSLWQKLFTLVTRIGEPGFWTVSASGVVVGSLVFESGQWRLSWFDNADRRLVDYAGPVTGDFEALTEAFSNRLGRRVSLDAILG